MDRHCRDHPGDAVSMACPRISLLLVSSSYPPVFGGSETEAQRISAGLITRGHRVTVLCRGGDLMPSVAHWIDPVGVPVRIFGRQGSERWRDRIFALRVAWTLIREHRRYQLVYFLMQGLHLASGLPAAKLFSTPAVMKVSGSNIITSMQDSWLGRLELKWLQRWTKRVMILNSGMAQEASRAGFQPAHLLWMPNPVDVAEFKPCDQEQRRDLRANAGIPAEAFVILYVGRLAPEKALPSLIDAFGRLAHRFPETILILVGDGPERPALLDRIAKLGLNPRVRMTGRVDGTEVRQWLQLADVFTLVSSLEGFPCSLVEAMATALPAVVSDIPGNTQLIDQGVHGLVTEQGNSEAIAEALTRLFMDADLRARMGQSARKRVVDNYSIDRVLDRYEELFAEVLAP